MHALHRAASVRKSATKMKTETKKRKKKKQISEEMATKLQSKLKAACIDTAPAKFFKKFDKDKSGDMDAAELTRMIRVSLKIGKDQLSDGEIKALIDALDDDGSGSLSLDELGDFVERGTKTFYSEAKAGEDGEKVQKWGAKAEEPDELKKLKKAKKRGKRRSFNEEVMHRFQMKLQAAVFGGSPQEFFAKFDKGGDGTLDAGELKAMIRKSLRIPGSELSDGDIDAFVRAVDDDGTGTLSLAELGDFVEHGTKTFFADAATAASLSEADDSSVGSGSHASHRSKALKWGERAEECEAAKEDRKARLAKKRRPDFDPEVMRKLQGRLQAATFGNEPLDVFKHFDASGDGTLDLAELTRMIRVELRISGSEISDDMISAFVRAIDDDGNMTVSLEELADFVQFGMATFYADHEASAANAPARARGKAMAWGERAPEAQAAIDARAARRKQRLRPDFDAAVMRKLQMRLREAIGPEPALDALARFDRSGDGQLDLEELTRMVRVNLRITEADLKDSDIAAFLRVLDDDKSGFLSVEELAEFAEHGISHFYHTEALDGKSVKLPLPPGCDAEALGRIIGALQSRLKGRPVRPLFAAIDGDGDGRVSEKAFVEAVRGDVLHLDEDELDPEDCSNLVKICAAERRGEVDVRKVAALVKRGGDVFADLRDKERKLVRDFTKITRMRIERATSKRVIQDYEAKQPKPNPLKNVPPLGPRLAPFHAQLFGWLDDVKQSPLKPAFKKNLHDFDQAKGAHVGQGSMRTRGHAVLIKGHDDLGPSNVDVLKALRTALEGHEALGSNVAAAAVLLKMGRVLSRAPLHRDHPRGRHRALELKCAGEACVAAARCFEKALDSAHPTYAASSLDAGDALLRAEEEWVAAHQKGGQYNFDAEDLDDAAEAERVAMLQLAQRALSNVRSAQAAVAVKSMTPKEVVDFSKTHTLLAVVFARQGVGPKAEENFDKALKMFARLKLSQRNACKADEADHYKHRAFAAFRNSDFQQANAFIKDRERLLTEALGPGDPVTVECRRVRILWTMELGAGAGTPVEDEVSFYDDESYHSFHDRGRTVRSGDRLFATSANF